MDLENMKPKSKSTMERVNLLFKRSGLSLDELGQRMGYSGDLARKSAWQFLTKTTNPRLTMLERFAEALNLSLVDLLK
jgi:transcriptional regulator with XRE-family HTH domain